MNRHLHNTLSALSASGALLVLGLIAAAPLMPQDAHLAPRTLVATTSAVADPGPEPVIDATAVTLLADALEQAATQNIDTAPPQAARSAQRQRRQTLVMPYLSFVPRG